MTNTQDTIRKIINERDMLAIFEERRKELAQMVDQHGVEIVAAATGLNGSTISQYLRDKYSKIGSAPLEQARYVFEQLAKLPDHIQTI